MPPERIDVVTAFVEDDAGRILLLKRSGNVRTYPGQWGAVSGYLEALDPFLQAERELRQETGLSRNDVTLVRKGTPLVVDDGGHSWRIHPFRFRRTDDDRTVELSREHSEYTWVEADEITSYETVPELGIARERTYP